MDDLLPKLARRWEKGSFAGDRTFAFHEGHLQQISDIFDSMFAIDGVLPYILYQTIYIYIYINKLYIFTYIVTKPKWWIVSDMQRTEA